MADKNLTSFVAWWGAIVATLVFLWDIYKWFKSGANILVSVQPNMQTFGELTKNLKDTSYVVVEAVNKGNKKTTITHLIACHYPSLIKKILKKQSTAFFVANTGPSQPLPHILEPGERWIGIIQQNENLERMARSGYLYCGIYHSLKTKPVLKRVHIDKGK